MLNDQNNRNMKVLKLLQTLLRLKPGQIAKAGQVSPAYVTRLLKNEIPGSDAFWSALNANLLKEASSSIFELSCNIPENADELIAELKAGNQITKVA